jgi:NAD(P)H-dependent flavin oxidoreductase YrpB (nitropropane dioxygenase family)
MKFFNSKYPIVEAIMNPVSDLNLALAISDAGCFPSLHYRSTTDSTSSEKLDEILTEFVKSNGNSNVLVTYNPYDLDCIGVLKVLKKHKPSHLEITCATEETINYDISSLTVNKKIENNVKMAGVYSKLLFRINKPSENSNLISGFCIKGQESAGKTGEYKISDLFEIQKNKTKDKVFVPYGSIKTSKDVRDYINRGATAVAVGTLFACSKESCLSDEVKQKMVSSTSENLSKSKFNQNQLVLGEIKEEINDDWNRPNALAKYIKGDGKHGFIYASSAIDFISEVRSVKEIVEYLTEKLK